MDVGGAVRSAEDELEGWWRGEEVGEVPGVRSVSLWSEVRRRCGVHSHSVVYGYGATIAGICGVEGQRYWRRKRASVDLPDSASRNVQTFAACAVSLTLFSCSRTPSAGDIFICRESLLLQLQETR